MPTTQTRGFFSKPGIWILLILLLGGFLFYWFQLRPTQLYRKCTEQSSADARKLLGSKFQIAQSGGNTALATQYQDLISRNMYLRSDYNSFLRKCLLYYGLPDVSDAADAEESVGQASSSQQ